ncbi:MAG: hypothetical protein AB1505_15490 [Candidatus Latescibacterota bacterium]
MRRTAALDDAIGPRNCRVLVLLLAALAGGALLAAVASVARDYLYGYLGAQAVTTPPACSASGRSYRSSLPWSTDRRQPPWRRSGRASPSGT